MEYIFYKISCNNPDIKYTYVGSTKNLRHRLWQHKSDVTNEASKAYNLPLYKTIRENGGCNNWRIDPIGKGIFEKRVDALIEEQKYINDNKSTLNTHKAVMTKEDNDNYKKQYVINNPEKVKESNKKYRETHKEEIKDKIKNDIELQAKRKEKTTCECGGCYTYSHKAEHFRSKQHINHFS
jgi:hypothetical protein